MRFFIRIISLALALTFCFSGLVFGDTIDDLETRIEALLDEREGFLTSNDTLNDVISDLQQQLEEAKKDPTKPLPRRPVVVIVEPLLVEIEAGKSKTVEFEIRNIALDSAKNVVTTFSIPEGSGLTGAFTDKNSNISSIVSRASRKLSFEIKADKSVKEGFHTLLFVHNYLNEYNEELECESVITLKVTTGTIDGGVTLKNIGAVPQNISPGGNFDIEATIHNSGTTAIKDVSITIDGMSSDSIYLRNSTNVTDISTLAAGGSQSLSMGFTSSSKAKRGSYPLTLELSYTDSAGESQSKSYTYYVNISAGQANENAAEVVITNITSPSASMGVGQEFSMTATLKNTSAYAAKNVKIAAKPEGDGAVVPKSTSIASIPALSPGEEREMTFKFAATASSKSQNYVIGFGVDYETGIEDDDGKQETNSFTQYQGVNVTNPDADKEEDDEKKTSTPKIIVSAYKSDPIIVKAGQEFDLDMTFLNTSGEKAVKNIKVILSVLDEVVNAADRKGSVFTPVDSSNTFYIDEIGPKGEVEKHIRLYTLPDASPKNYIINVKFEYEDKENNAYEATESVGINVKQTTRLDTSEISIDQYGSLYQPIFINFELYNTGKVTLSNLMLKVDGNFEATQSSVYYGSFSPSSTEYYDNQIMPTEEGLQEGAIVITYEDDTGELIEERIEFSVEVSPPMDMGADMGMRPDMGMNGDMVWDEKTGTFVPANAGLSTPVKIGIGVGAAVIVAAAAFIGLRIRKKKQESIDLDE